MAEPERGTEANPYGDYIELPELELGDWNGDADEPEGGRPDATEPELERLDLTADETEAG